MENKIVPPLDSEVIDRLSSDQYSESAAYVNARQDLREALDPEFYIYDTILDKLETSPDNVILDVGCGSGVFTVKIAEINKGPVIGIDRFEIYTGGSAIAKIKNLNNLYFAQMDGRETLLPNDSVDSAILAFSIYHMGNPLDSLVEIKRVLKPDGQLILATRTTGDLRKMWEISKKVATDLGYKLPVSFYDNFDIEKAETILPEMFDLTDPPLLHVTEGRLAENDWEKIQLALAASMISWEGLEFKDFSYARAVLFNEHKKIFDAEIKSKGYYSDYLKEAVFFCKNSKKSNSLT